MEETFLSSRLYLPRGSSAGRPEKAETVKNDGEFGERAPSSACENYIFVARVLCFDRDDARARKRLFRFHLGYILQTSARKAGWWGGEKEVREEFASTFIKVEVAHFHGATSAEKFKVRGSRNSFGQLAFIPSASDLPRSVLFAETDA